MKGCFVCKKADERFDYVFAHGRRELFEKQLDICKQVINEDNLEENKGFLRDTEVMISTWGMVEFSTQQLDEYFPNLKLVLYAAGSVQLFARPFLERGIRIVSAWGVMCNPVAEFTVASIVFLNKGAFFAADSYKNDSYETGKKVAAREFPGTYNTKIGILGAGMIGSRVVELLRNYTVELMVYDPFLSEEKMKKLGLNKLYSLDEIFSECQTISNHIANNPKTVGMLNYSLFSLMRDNAAFINTGRGAQVVESDLVRALQEKPRRFALLDVTWPEPMEKDNPLLLLSNVIAFPHIAGSAEQEVLMLSDCVYEQLLRYQSGKEIEFEVTLPMLETMA